MWVATHNNRKIADCSLHRVCARRFCVCERSFRAFREQLLDHPSLSLDLRRCRRARVGVERDQWKPTPTGRDNESNHDLATVGQVNISWCKFTCIYQTLDALPEL
jgi:hypothetical protein